MKKLKVGMLGTGDVGRTLGRGLASLGHDVMLGSRDPADQKVRFWLRDVGVHGSAGSYAEAARFGELLVLATSWEGTENAIHLAGMGHFDGKVVIDVTNPLLPPADKGPRLALGHNDSGGEQVQRWLPHARVVKAFNSIGHAQMVNPEFPDGPPDMFLCGNDEGAKSTVTAMCVSLGWGTIDAGGIDASRLLEPMAMLWIACCARAGDWNLAFKVLRKARPAGEGV